MAQEDVLRNSLHIVKSMGLYFSRVKFTMDWVPFTITDKMVLN